MQVADMSQVHNLPTQEEMNVLLSKAKQMRNQELRRLMQQLCRFFAGRGFAAETVTQ